MELGLGVSQQLQNADTNHYQCSLRNKEDETDRLGQEFAQSFESCNALLFGYIREIYVARISATISPNLLKILA